MSAIEKSPLKPWWHPACGQRHYVLAIRISGSDADWATAEDVSPVMSTALSGIRNFAKYIK